MYKDLPGGRRVGPYELEDCPFCGSKAQLLDSLRMYRKGAKFLFAVGCTKKGCAARTPFNLLPGVSIMIWNSRAKLARVE